jgi:hypothetical protein
MVRINDLVLGVNIALDLRPVADCEAFANAQGVVDISQLVKGVNNALDGCPATPTITVGETPTATQPGATATATETTPPTSTTTPTNTAGPTNTAAATATETSPPTSTTTPTNTAGPTNTTAATPTVTPSTESTPTPTPTATTAPVCPVAPGVYTITNGATGTLQVASIGPFPFPSGGTVVQDVGPGDANCVHNTVVPFPGGFASPQFCIPVLNFNVLVIQTGCGVGRLDSNGGSDFTVIEHGDTSDASATCNLPDPDCNPTCASTSRSGTQLPTPARAAGPPTHWSPFRCRPRPGPTPH